MWPTRLYLLFHGYHSMQRCLPSIKSHMVPYPLHRKLTKPRIDTRVSFTRSTHSERKNTHILHVHMLLRHQLLHFFTVPNKSRVHQIQGTFWFCLYPLCKRRSKQNAHTQREDIEERGGIIHLVWQWTWKRTEACTWLTGGLAHAHDTSERSTSAPSLPSQTANL